MADSIGGLGLVLKILSNAQHPAPAAPELFLSQVLALARMPGEHFLARMPEYTYYRSAAARVFWSSPEHSESGSSGVLAGIVYKPTDVSDLSRSLSGVYISIAIQPLSIAAV